MKRYLLSTLGVAIALSSAGNASAFFGMFGGCGCAAEPSCGCAMAEPSCGCAEPSCGCEMSCCDSCCDPCGGRKHKLFGKLKDCCRKMKHACCDSCCEPSCGCAEPSCGCAEPSCGCAAEPSCGCAEASCGCY